MATADRDLDITDGDYWLDEERDPSDDGSDCPELDAELDAENARRDAEDNDPRTDEERISDEMDAERKQQERDDAPGGH